MDRSSVDVALLATTDDMLRAIGHLYLENLVLRRALDQATQATQAPVSTEGR